jgi:hypothetical protein
VTADRVRSRRRVLGVVAAVVFVAVAAGSLNGFVRSAEVRPPATSAPSPVTSPLTATPTPSTVPSGPSVTPTDDGGYAERLDHALRGLPMGDSPRYDVVIGSALYRAGGGRIDLPARPGMVIDSAAPGRRSWLITYSATYSASYSAGPQGRRQVVLVTADGATHDLGDGPRTSVAVTADGTRAAVLIFDGRDTHASVIELPSGRETAHTTLPSPGLADGGLRAVGWSGNAIVLSRPASDPSPTWADVWDPTQGPYLPDPTRSRAFRFIGRYGSSGNWLAMTPAGAEDCLVVVHPAADFTIRQQRCGLGLFLSPSPDGQRLFRPKDGPLRTWETLDTAAVLAGSSAWVTLGAPAGTEQPQVWAEDATSVLVAVAVPPPGEPVPPEHWLDLVRCPINGGPCQRVPVPTPAPGERAILAYPR